MGFIPHRNDGSHRAQALEWLTCASSQTPKIGLAMKYSSGKLVLCSGTTKPEYI